MLKKIAIFVLLALPTVSFAAHVYTKNAHTTKRAYTHKKHRQNYKGEAIKPPLYRESSLFDFYLSGGAAISNISNSTTVPITPSVTNNYVTDTQTRTGPIGGFGFGRTYKNIVGKPMNASLALMGYYVGFNQIQGTEYPLVNDGPGYDTLDYNFKAESYAAMLESRFAYNPYPFKPFLLLGIGASWNHLFDYNEVPTNPSLSAAPVPEFFEDNFTTAFAYEVGAGVQYELPHAAEDKFIWSLALEYRYMNMGNGELSAFPADTLNNPLKVSTLDTQAALLTLQISG